MSHLNIRVYEASEVAVDTNRKTKRSTKIIACLGSLKNSRKDRSTQLASKFVPMIP